MLINTEEALDKVLSTLKDAKTKVCSSCKKELSLENFNSRGSNRGYSSLCKACQKEYRKEHYSINKESYIQNTKLWVKDNRAKRKKIALDFYYRKGKAKNIADRNKIRAEAYGLTEHHTAEDILYLFAISSGVCFYCGKEEKRAWTIDHKTPLSRKGSNTKENLCICCKNCNSSKHDKTEEEFYEYNNY